MTDSALSLNACKFINITAADGDKVARLLQGAYVLPHDFVKAANEAMELTGAASEI